MPYKYKGHPVQRITWKEAKGFRWNTGDWCEHCNRFVDAENILVCRGDWYQPDEYELRCDQCGREGVDADVDKPYLYSAVRTHRKRIPLNSVKWMAQRIDEMVQDGVLEKPSAKLSVYGQGLLSRLANFYGRPAADAMALWRGVM